MSKRGDHGHERRRYYSIEPLRRVIRLRMNDRGLTQKDVAGVLGVAPNTVSNILSRGKRDVISEYLVERYATRLGYTLYDLYGGMADRPKQRGKPEVAA